MLMIAIGHRADIYPRLQCGIRGRDGTRSAFANLPWRLPGAFEHEIDLA